jgi:hypothetical protein
MALLYCAESFTWILDLLGANKGREIKWTIITVFVVIVLGFVVLVPLGEEFE